MCTTLKKKKAECFCYVFDRVAIGNVHSVVSNVKGLV